MLHSRFNSAKIEGVTHLKPSYEYTQIGYLTISAIGGTLIFLIILMAVSEFNWASVIVLLILASALMLFATLKTRLSEDWLEIRFGIGIIHKKIFLKDIQSAEAIQYPWYYGWGLRYSFRGEWIYSVSGLKAVKVETKTGEKYILGTDKPEELASAVRKAVDGHHFIVIGR